MKVQMLVLGVAPSDDATCHHNPFCGVCEDFLEIFIDLGRLRATDHDGDFGLRSVHELEADEVGTGFVPFADGGDASVGDDVAAVVGSLDEAMRWIDDLVRRAFSGAGDGNDVVVVENACSVEGCDFPQTASFFRRWGVAARSCGCSVCAWWRRVLSVGFCGSFLGAGDMSVGDTDEVFWPSRSLHSFNTDQEWVVVDRGEFFCVFVASFNMGCERGYPEVGAHFYRFESARDRRRLALLPVSGVAGALQGRALGGVKSFVVVNSNPLARKRVECTKHVPKLLRSLVGGQSGKCSCPWWVHVWCA